MVASLVMTSLITAGAGIVAVLLLLSVILLSMFLILGWFYAIVKELQPYLPPQSRKKPSSMLFFALFPVVYISAFLLFLLAGAEVRPEGNMAVISVLLLVVHLFAMFCIFYCLYQAAKTLKTAELGAPATFSDFAGEFFLMWFYVVGVWILQPRINAIISRPPRPEMDIFGYQES